MSRGMRNFWLSAEADGRQTPATCSPRTNDGEMFIDLRWLVNGQSESALTIHCVPLDDGKLQIQIKVNAERGAITEDTFRDFASHRRIILET